VVDVNDEPPGMAEMLWAARRIWGYESMDLRDVAECVSVVSGDLSRQGRALAEGRAPDMDQVAKELGNLMFSARRWMDDLGLDAMRCLELAMASQQEYADELRRDWGRPT
jgi:hypothetical protein